jgi:D-serine deaminase-like pyridoxal phosphate-dependent protein
MEVPMPAETTNALPARETPYLLLDVAKLDANIARMKKRLSRFDVMLRPHVKTNKSAYIAERFFDTDKRPVTVSTLHEAEYFFKNGFTDILYGVAIAPNKFEHVKELLLSGADLKLILDNADTAELLLEFAATNRLPVNILLEIDCDGHRSGLQPRAPEIGDIAKLLGGSFVSVRGVMTHAGNSYNSASAEEIKQYANQERDAVVTSAAMLRELGADVCVVSVGSTPTALFGEDLTGVTEVRAGNFAFFDLVMHGLGVCGLDEIALSVVATIIGHQKEKGWIITDAGWMALSRDRGTAKQKIDQGYGVVCDMDGNPIDNLIVIAANQEHGIISARDSSAGVSVPDLSVGAQVRILPNHACATAAQFSGYHLLNLAESSSGYWPRSNGW